MFPSGHVLSNDKGSTCQPLEDATTQWMPVQLQLSDAHFVKVFPPATIHSSFKVCIAFNTVLPAQPTCPLPLPKHLGMHFCFGLFQQSV